MNYEKLPKTISAEELLSTPLPPVKWIIPDLLPAGLALFAGPSKAGKSWLTLWLCLQVAQGKPMWGREIEPHTVLYLSLEDTFNRLQKRLLQLVGSEEAPERLVMQTECSSIGQGLEEQLTSFIYQHPDTGLIVIDTLQKVRSSDQNNSMYASDYKEISALKALADKYNVCILLIMRGKICGLYRNVLVNQAAWWRSMPTRVSAKGRSPRSNAIRSAWHWPARSGASAFRCWSPHT